MRFKLPKNVSVGALSQKLPRNEFGAAYLLAHILFIYCRNAWIPQVARFADVSSRSTSAEEMWAHLAELALVLFAAEALCEAAFPQHIQGVG